MSKVVTERPRRGHSNPSKKTAKTLSKDEILDEIYDDKDSGPTRHKASRHGQYGWNAKEFSDLLGPLRGYLKKNVGRPWNKVHSEMSKALDRRSVAGSHIWDHVRWEVQQNCYMEGKQVLVMGRFGVEPYPVQGLYVHPVTGILMSAPTRRYRYRPTVDDSIRKLDDTTELRRLDGIWYRVAYKWVDVSYPHLVRGNPTPEIRYKKELRLDKKAQLSKGQLKTYGLKNEPVAAPIPRKKLARLTRPWVA
jgi:hypothetical protein